MSQLRKRRDLLKLSVLAAGAWPVACYRATVPPQPLSEQESAAYFPQSVASGDPRPDSVVLWVRALDPANPERPAPLELLVALDPEMTQPVALGEEAASLVALPDSDHCLAVRLAGLMPGTTYYYRFRYQLLEGVAESRVARTRTAPALDSAAPARFAVMCCQDYGGKYFHVARHIANLEVDFVLHLGDYIYETVGDPTFQSGSAERQPELGKPEEALELGEGEQTFLAAQSLSNYRDLYQAYRSDPDLQALHERHPIIAIWDDHEFSDDSHGDVATYRDGTEDEASPARRAAADRAWSEYMPIDYTPREDESATVATKLEEAGDFPDNFRVYRSFVFGKHLELVLTDLRRFRPDHLVPEDAPPGAIFLSAEEVAEAFADAPADLVPYVDLDAPESAAYTDALRANADALAITADSLRGNFSAVWLNRALESLGDVGLEPFDLDDPSLPRGYAYHSLLKNQQFSRVGSRYVVAVGPFEALAQKLWRQSRGQSENLMGAEQRAWFLRTLRDSTRTFKIWGSEIAFQPRHIDLTQVTAVPVELRQRISISAEDWDGFPNERRELLRELADAGNVVVLSGDLHCFFAGTPFLEQDAAARVVELTTGSVSSTTWLDGIQGSLVQDGGLPMNVELLVRNLGALLSDTTARPNPHLAFQELGKNGYTLVEVGPNDVVLTVRTIATEHVATPPGRLESALDDLFEEQRFRTRHDSAELEQEIEGRFATWDLEKMAFQ